MGRPVILSNGQLFVGLDENGSVHDFYYPYVGLENLTNARSLHHKIGVWVDGVFSWTDDDNWQVRVDFETNALVSSIQMHSDELQITLRFTDFIDTEYNAFIRRVTVTNEASDERDVRLFMHQVFQISRAGRADTALFVPDDNYILDYKGRYCLLIAGKFTDDGDFDQFAVGNYGIEGKSGTFRDAEDGELSGNAIEHGGVDSVLRFKRKLAGGKTFEVDYWIVAADSQADVQLIHTHLKYYPLDKRLQTVRNYWENWLHASNEKLHAVPEPYNTALRKSLLIIKAHCDARGSILASGDSTIFNFGRDYYCYCWPRDSAYALWPLLRLGQYEEAKLFFEFARDTIHPDGYLMHKYQPDRAIGSTWHPLLHGKHKELAIQEDETATVIYMLGEYWRLTKDRIFVENFYNTFIEPCASFMIGFIDDTTGLPHASYDLWEQKFLTSSYTVATVIAGLEAAAEMAEAFERTEDAVKWRRVASRMRDRLDVLYHPDGYFRKGFLLQENGDLDYDDTLDASSFYGIFMFAGLSLDDPRLQNTFKHVSERLCNTSPIGGVLRYEHDGYFLAKRQYKGNPWVVCTMWLAQYYLDLEQPDKAKELVKWAMDRAQPSGSLSEQFDPETGFAISVTPLVWSHAELANTILDLSSNLA
jgi:GH15 family glucan-1,4-alpha-glucosidase